MRAAEYGHKEVVKLLLLSEGDNNCYINLQNEEVCKIINNL